mgnify:CR=1 FL=1
MDKNIVITLNDFMLFHDAVNEKKSLAEGADSEDYVSGTKKLIQAHNRIVERNNLNPKFKI